VNGAFVFFGFGVVVMLAAAPAAGFFAGTAPDGKEDHGQNDCQNHKLLPVHAANITAIGNRANGIFRANALHDFNPQLNFPQVWLGCAHG
jgi:hypothetical protein